MDCSVHGILQDRILEWVAFPFSRGSSQPRDRTRSPTLQVDSLLADPQGKPKNTGVGSLSLLQRIFLTQKSNRGLLHLQADSLPTELWGTGFKDMETNQPWNWRLTVPKATRWHWSDHWWPIWRWLSELTLLFLLWPPHSAYKSSHPLLVRMGVDLWTDTHPPKFTGVHPSNLPISEC